MDLHQAIFGRRAVREYTPDPIDEQTIRDLIEAAVPGAERGEPATVDIRSGSRSGRARSPLA
jgi:hypothetical protein